MPARHPCIPDHWLMTDERMGEALWEVLERLPPGTGVIFRHYSLSVDERRAIFARVARIARRRRLVLIRAGETWLGRGEQGVHGRGLHRLRGLRTWPAHHAREVQAGIRAGADAILISPVFATKSHPGAKPLGPIRAAILARRAKGRAIAMGGTSAQTHKRLNQLGFRGWAAIDGWRPRAD